MTKSKTPRSLQEIKEEKVKLLEEKLEQIHGLPHLHGLKFYPWMREFFECTDKDAFITAANQIGKSSIQIRKMIHWATDMANWPRLWAKTPRVFWYFYPSKDVATLEFYEKWVPEFLPRGKYKNHPVYGWKDEKKDKQIHSVSFNSGVTIYFKSYEQGATNLQAATLDYIGCDEELPEELWDELNYRRMAKDGYLSMVFTATLGQDLWRVTMEEQGTPQEKFPHAWKKQVSLFDCQVYEDGTPSHWTPEKIKRAILSCKNEAEIQRRIYGRFVVDSGRKYHAFLQKEHTCEPHEIPPNWHWSAGVDVGAGGKENHPSAVIFVAIAPDFSEARVVRGWKGTENVTTAGDTYEQFVRMRGRRSFTWQFYDFHSKDFHTISSRAGDSFLPADKSHEVGEQILNTIFKTGILKIFNIPELWPLATELSTLKKGGDKRKLVDDLSDALRYAVTRVPWPFEVLAKRLATIQPQDIPAEEKFDMDRERQLSAKGILVGANPMAAFEESVEAELEAWGELYDI